MSELHREDIREIVDGLYRIGEVFSLEGRPLGGALIQIVSLPSVVLDTAVLTDVTGYFEVGDIEPGRYKSGQAPWATSARGTRPEAVTELACRRSIRDRVMP